MYLRSDVQYCTSSTLFRKQIIVGIAEQNSYVKFEEKYIDTIIRLVNLLKRENSEEATLSCEEKQIASLFENYGYFDNGQPVKTSFNEYKKLGNELFSIQLRNFSKVECRNLNLLTGIIVFISLACIMFSVVNSSFFTRNIDIFNMSVFEIIFCLTVLPILVTFTHEFGHYVVSQLAGVRTKNLSVGFLLVYPIVLVRYSGLHLCSTRKKILVVLAGIFFNLLGMTLGISLNKLGFRSAILDLWILAHWSGILANIGIIGLKDGYFFLTAITGFMNLRMKGYMGLKRILTGKGEKRAGRQDTVMAAVLAGAFILSLILSIVQLSKYSSVFRVPGYISWILCAVFCIVLTVNFIFKIRAI